MVTNRHKFHLLIVSMIIFFIIIYKFSVEKTITIIRDTNRIETQIDSVNYRLNKLRVLEDTLSYFNKTINEQRHSQQPREYLLKITGDYCGKYNKMSVQYLPEEVRFNNSNYTTVLNDIIISGRFKELIDLLYTLERDKRVGSIESVTLYKEERFRSNREILLMKITVKSILNETDS